MHEGYVDHETSYLLQLPFVRLMVSGRPWVFTFFVISGYTLSYRPLQLIQQGGRMDKAYAALSSSLFRRWMRLFIPAVVLNLPVPLLAYYSWYRSEVGQPLKMPHGSVLTINPPLQPSLWLQYVDFVSAAVQLVDPFADRGVPREWAYNTVAWTLPIEFVGSMLVYSVVLGLAQCTPAARLVLTAMLAGVASWLGYWAQFLFLSGVFLASLGLYEELWDWLASLREARLPLLSSLSSSTSARSPSAIPQRRWPGTIVSTLLQVVPFLMTLYVLGTPTWSRGGKDAPGYAWLSAFIPTRYIAIGKPDFFLTPVAAVALVSVLSAAPLLQRCFTTRLALYLGHISYSLYLVHATILHGPGIRLGATFLEMTGADTDLGYILGVGGAAVVVWVACIWCADLGTRLVDAQAIRFGRWIHGKATGL